MPSCCSNILIHYVDPSTNDTMLEVYHLPRDTWMKEIEDIKVKISQVDELKSNDATVAQPLPSTAEVAIFSSNIERQNSDYIF